MEVMELSQLLDEEVKDCRLRPLKVEVHILCHIVGKPVLLVGHQHLELVLMGQELSKLRSISSPPDHLGIGGRMKEALLVVPLLCLVVPIVPQIVVVHLNFILIFN
jgi:hypothetical protein